MSAWTRRRGKEGRTTDTRLFARRLRKMRVKRGISCRVLSELCGLSPGQVARYENGKCRGVTARTVVLLAEELGVSVDWLLGIDKKS